MARCLHLWGDLLSLADSRPSEIGLPLKWMTVQVSNLGVIQRYELAFATGCSICVIIAITREVYHRSISGANLLYLPAADVGDVRI